MCVCVCVCVCLLVRACVHACVHACVRAFVEKSIGVSHILGQHLRGSFDVTNFSDQLPLKFEITAPDGVELSLCRGLLEGTARNKKDDVRNSVRIDFSLHSRCVSVCLCICVSLPWSFGRHCAYQQRETDVRNSVRIDFFLHFGYVSVCRCVGVSLPLSFGRNRASQER